jgi:hypothetical protein
VVNRIYVTGFAGMLAAPAIWFYQIIHWLKFGVWRAFSISDGLRWAGMTEPQFRWRSLQRISSLVMSLPLSITIFVVILGALAAVTQWSEAMTEPYGERASETVRRLSK